MLPRSLANFMNAFTATDYTTYPFATTNGKDFNNLMSVFLDATLHPFLNKSDFDQEGWRIGPENPLAVADGAIDGSDSKLVFKGVVYNEMKGQMSDARYLFQTRFQDHFFPDIHSHAGDPQKITSLKHEALKRFHLGNYHPSNAKLFTYGDMPVAEHLMEVNQQFDHFYRRGYKGKRLSKTPISLRDGPLHVVVDGPVDPLVAKDMQHKTSITWLMGDNSNILESFSLSIMISLLLDGYGSPLHRNLIETGIGQDWTPNTGYGSAGSFGTFSVGLCGVKKEDIPKFQTAVSSTLHEVYRSGFDKGKVDGLLHQLELALKHKTANFGMSLMMRLLPGWFNGIDPFAALAWDETVAAFKHAFAKGDYLEGLLKKYLLNHQTLNFTMEPSETYGEILAANETKRLAHKISLLSAVVGGEIEARKYLNDRELELVEAQNAARSQDLSCLPRVYIKDISRKMENKQVRDSLLGDIKVQWREADTNGLTYFRAIDTFEGLPTDLRMLIPLFNDAIMRLGTKQKTIEEIEDLIQLKTGGISVSYCSATSPLDLRRATEGLLFTGSALDKNIPEMYEIFRMILQETDFDGAEARSRIHELLRSGASGALNAIANSGNSYALRYAERNLMPQGLLNEQSNGLTQIQYYTTLARRSASEGMDDIISKLKGIQQFAISNSTSLRTALTCGPEAASSNEAALQKFLSGLSSSKSIPKSHADLSPDDFSAKTFISFPYQVYYSALALPTVAYVHPDSAPLQILSQLLTHKHLHHEIREKGGAYGGGAYAHGVSGTFGFYSYRDPNPQNTIKIMQEAGRWAQMKEWSDQDIEEAKISVFQEIDAPQSVSEEGMTRFLANIDQEMEQGKREQLLDVEIKDIQEVAQKYLVEGMGKANLAILGEKKEWINKQEGWHVKNMQMIETSEDVSEAAAQRS